ncbi:nitrile hydratase accessory protein [Pseudaestuariivita atlantica]|uniref:Nitrile hydratase n=1 Tax=Pseudaestuariivita atlantica TaxID=1317121 RepID=A0A0L1JM95_9RHOB|nr:nitrile hydratase accessory protein [Pseudaestuariivita atlantica]KNG92879.1 hypothetical protein ATO11_15595 [Pseudaestuariivita atlantica]
MTAPPGFDAPWQAQLYAVTRALEGEGLFTAAEWSDALGAALDEARADGPVDGGPGYWLAWMAALEGLLRQRSGIEAAEIAEKVTAWRAAYLSTPHGQPVRLDG